MASSLYAKGREGFLDGSIDWDTNTIKVVGISTASYTVDLATHDNLNDIPGGARTGTSSALTGKTVTDGVADADDTSLAAVSVDTQALVVFKDTGTESTSRLIAYLDSGSGLPFTANGGAMNILWNSGSNRIFKL